MQLEVKKQKSKKKISEKNAFFGFGIFLIIWVPVNKEKLIERDFTTKKKIISSSSTI